MLLRIHSAGLSKHRTRYWSISICRLSQQTSCGADLQYHIVMDNYFTSPALLRHLSAIGVAATRTVRANRTENAPLRDIVKINKEKRGSSDVVTDESLNITVVRCKGNKVKNAISTFTGKQPIKQVKCYFRRKKRRVNIEQPNIGGVDRMDQNISAHMINLRTKK